MGSRWILALCVVCALVLTGTDALADHDPVEPGVRSLVLGLGPSGAAAVVTDDGSVVTVGFESDGVAPDPELGTVVTWSPIDPEEAPDFGVDGTVVLPYPEFGFPTAAGVDSTGRVTIAFSRFDVTQVVRLAQDGSLDETFGDAGFIDFPFLTEVNSIVVGRDDTLYLGGAIPHVAGFTNFMVAKVAADGALDPDYGDAGVASIDIDHTGGWSDRAEELALRRDGSVVAVGSKDWFAGSTVPAIVQLRPDGSSDHDFGDRGTLLLGPLPDENVMENGSADTVALRRDGTLVVGVTYSRSTVHSTHLISLLSNGDPNPRFGVGGVVVGGLLPDRIHTVREGPRGIVYAGGLSQLVRTHASGQFDERFGFGFGGILTGVSRFDIARDGRLYVLGNSAEVYDLLDPVPGAGMWLVTGAGALHDLGEAAPLARPGMPGLSATPVDAAAASNDGLWILARDGSVVSEGAAPDFGDATDVVLDVDESWVAIAATSDGSGFWLVSSRGRVSAHGSAAHHGDALTFDLDGRIIDIAAAPDGSGYVLLGDEGGVFTFGSATFHGSIPALVPAGRAASDWLRAPVVAIAMTESGRGYSIAAGDGAVFTFGDATFHGSVPGVLPPGAVLDGTIVDIIPSDGGYSLIAGDGGVFAFGRTPFVGSLAGGLTGPGVLAVVPLPDVTPKPPPPVTHVQGIVLCRELDRELIVPAAVDAEVGHLTAHMAPLLMADDFAQTVSGDPNLGVVRVGLERIDDVMAAEVARRVGTYGLCLAGELVGEAAIAEARPALLIGASPSAADLSHAGDPDRSRFVDIDLSADEDGLWITRADGAVEARGSAAHHGDRPALDPGEDIVGLVPTEVGNGYWLVSSRGRTWSYGDATPIPGIGDLRLAAPIVDATRVRDQQGLYLLGGDGGVFVLGAGTFWGSVAQFGFATTATSIDATSDGYLVSARIGDAAGDSIFAFGSPDFLGRQPVFSAVARPPRSIVDVDIAADGSGRIEFADDGAVEYVTGTEHGHLRGFVERVVAAAVLENGGGLLVLDDTGAVYPLGAARHVGVVRHTGNGRAMIEGHVPDGSIIYLRTEPGPGAHLHVEDADGERRWDIGTQLPREGFYLARTTHLAAALDVNAFGAWTLEILPPSYGRVWRSGEGAASGTIPDVLLMDSADPVEFVASSTEASTVRVWSRDLTAGHGTVQWSGPHTEIRGAGPTWDGPSVVGVRTRGIWGLRAEPTARRPVVGNAPGWCWPGLVGFLDHAASIDFDLMDLLGLTFDRHVNAISMPGPGHLGFGGSRSGGSFELDSFTTTCDQPGEVVGSVSMKSVEAGWVVVNSRPRAVAFPSLQCIATPAGSMLVGEIDVSGLFVRPGVVVDADARPVSGWENLVVDLGGGSVTVEARSSSGCPAAGHIAAVVDITLADGREARLYPTA